jgi:hypothetical protein
MRRILICWQIISLLSLGLSAQAATGKVIKVLPHFLDLQGRHALTPSLYERDAYQARLAQHPEERSAIRFDVEWKSKGPVWEPLKLRVEIRGTIQGDTPKEAVLERSVAPSGWLGSWTGLTLGGEDYKKFGTVTAWRVTLWENDQLLGEQQSFLW